jgi:sporulation protein YlmC with PRC-barrel domain
VELSGEPGAFSALIGRRVRGAQGSSLGRVFEVRAHWDGNGRLVIDELLIGHGGLLRRLRGPGPDARGIPWESVVEVADDHLVVRG